MIRYAMQRANVIEWCPIQKVYKNANIVVVAVWSLSHHPQQHHMKSTEDIYIWQAGRQGNREAAKRTSNKKKLETTTTANKTVKTTRRIQTFFLSSGLSQKQ